MRIGPEELTARFQSAMADARLAIDCAVTKDQQTKSRSFLDGLEAGYEIFANYRDEDQYVVGWPKPPGAEP